MNAITFGHTANNRLLSKVYRFIHKFTLKESLKNKQANKFLFACEQYLVYSYTLGSTYTLQKFGHSVP